MRTRTEGTAKPRAPLQSRTPCQACAASAFFCRPGSGARSVGRRTVPSSKPTPRPKSTRMPGLDCHEFRPRPRMHACKRLVVAAVARALCAPHRQPLPSSTRRSTLLVCGDRRTVAAPRHGAAAPGRHGHQTTPCRKPWRARVCRSTSRPAHPITELPPILSLNLDMSACLWRVETTVWNFSMSANSEYLDQGPHPF